MPEQIIKKSKRRFEQFDRSTAYLKDEKGCWIWQRAKIDSGKVQYGVAWNNIEQKNETAHRHIYKRLKGRIFDGLVLDHLCRVTLCVNPEHLEPVTYSENTIRGKTSKLSREIVSLIRELYDRGAAKQMDLAEMFKINQSNISRIVNKKRWLP